MSKNLFVVLALAIGMAAFACGGNVPANAGSNRSGNINSNTVIKLDPANMPPGISASPVPIPANAAGFPTNANVTPKGPTSTPGIPSPAELRKPFKPGTMPTPGIPSPEEIRKMLGQPPANVNAKPSQKMNEMPRIKSNKPIGGKP